MSFIAAFPAVYRDSLANGKRHNGRTRMEQRVDATRRDGTGPGIARRCIARCIALVTSFAGVGSDKETPPRRRRQRRQSGTSEGSTCTWDTKRPRIAVIARSKKRVSALVIACRKRAPSSVRRQRKDLARKQKRTSQSRTVTMTRRHPRVFFVTRSTTDSFFFQISE